MKTDISERRKARNLAAVGDNEDAKKDATRIRGPELPAYGRISFSDPNLYHSTPRMGHRMKPTGAESEETMRAYLKKYRPLKEGSWDTQDLVTLKHYFHDPYNVQGFEKNATSKDKGAEKFLAAEKRERRLRALSG